MDLSIKQRDITSTSHRESRIIGGKHYQARDDEVNTIILDEVHPSDLQKSPNLLDTLGGCLVSDVAEGNPGVSVLLFWFVVSVRCCVRSCYCISLVISFLFEFYGINKRRLFSMRGV